jgi:hypothetical protein
MFGHVPPMLMLTAVNPVSAPAANAGGRASKTGFDLPAVLLDKKDYSWLGRIGCYVRALLVSHTADARLS